MVTIDKLDISIYVQYARRTQMIEQINKQYHLEEAGAIPPQTFVMDLYPKLSEMDLLLGVVPLHTPWAHFFPPKSYTLQRRSSFTFSRIVPSLGSDQEQEEDEEKLDQVPCDSDEEKEEKKALQACFKQIHTINQWLSFIVGRVGQFLQG